MGGGQVGPQRGVGGGADIAALAEVEGTVAVGVGPGVVGEGQDAGIRKVGGAVVGGVIAITRRGIRAGAVRVVASLQSLDVVSEPGQ